MNLRQRLERLERLVRAHGYPEPLRLEELTDEQWEALLLQVC
jgi:hypothetical protein